MRLTKGLAERDARQIAEAVSIQESFSTVESLWRASGAGVKSLRCLARADAFGSMGLDRQRALWQIKPLRDQTLPLFEQNDATTAESKTKAGLDRLPPISPVDRVLHDYNSAGLSLKAHPLSFLRAMLDARGATPAGDLRLQRLCPAKRHVIIAGLVLCRQRPSTASGVTFITLEDETGIANLIIWRDTFERFRRAARLSTILLVHGVVEREGEVVHVHASRLESLDESLPAVASTSRDFH